MLKESTAYNLLFQGTIVLLLDGMDDISSDAQVRIAQNLQDGLDGCRTLSAVIACREDDFALLSPLLRGFAVLGVVPLTDADVRAFIQTLATVVDTSPIERAIDANPGVREAVRNPLLLRLLIYALSITNENYGALSDPALSAIALAGDLARAGDLDNALRVYEAAARGEGQLSTPLAEVLMGQTLAGLGKQESAEKAFDRAKSSYGALLENIATSTRSGLRIDEDQLKILRSLRVGVTYDDGQISGATLLPPGAVRRALALLANSGLVKADDDNRDRKALALDRCGAFGESNVVRASWEGPAASAVLAAVISLIEIMGQWRRFIYPRIYGWVFARVVVHGGTAAVAYGLLVVIFHGTDWYRGIFPVLVAGLCAPAIFRSQLALIGSGQESAADSPAVKFRHILGWIDDRIVEGSLVAESSWVVYHALPAIQKLPISTLYDHSRLYVSGTRRLRPSAKAKAMDFLDATKGEVTADTDKCRAIVYWLLEIGARDMVAQMMREAGVRRWRMRRAKVSEP